MWRKCSKCINPHRMFILRCINLNRACLYCTRVLNICKLNTALSQHFSKHGTSTVHRLSVTRVTFSCVPSVVECINEPAFGLADKLLNFEIVSRF